ncbi:hypothetical protein CS542_07835 [Pedobacter sp. IW39]|nr:hypothetical protein CS542_07835 [Pedobacter sp. IW39]
MLRSRLLSFIRLPMKLLLRLIPACGSKLGSGGNKITISGTPTVSGTLHYKITATGVVSLLLLKEI